MNENEFELDFDLQEGDIKKIAGLMGMSITDLAKELGVTRTYLSLANAGKEKASKQLKEKIINILTTHIIESSGDLEKDTLYDVIFYIKLNSITGHQKSTLKFIRSYINVLSKEEWHSAPVLEQIFRKFKSEDFRVLQRQIRAYKDEFGIE